MSDRFVLFKDSDGHLVSIKVDDIRNITFNSATGDGNNFYLVMYDTPHRKRKWDIVEVTEEQAEKLAMNLMVFAWEPRK